MKKSGNEAALSLFAMAQFKGIGPRELETDPTDEKTTTEIDREFMDGAYPDHEMTLIQDTVMARFKALELTASAVHQLKEGKELPEAGHTDHTEVTAEESDSQNTKTMPTEKKHKYMDTSNRWTSEPSIPAPMIDMYMSDSEDEDEDYEQLVTFPSLSQLEGFVGRDRTYDHRSHRSRRHSKSIKDNGGTIRKYEKQNASTGQLFGSRNSTSRSSSRNASSDALEAFKGRCHRRYHRRRRDEKRSTSSKKPESHHGNRKRSTSTRCGNVMDDKLPLGLMITTEHRHDHRISSISITESSTGRRIPLWSLAVRSMTAIIGPPWWNSGQLWVKYIMAGSIPL